MASIFARAGLQLGISGVVGSVLGGVLLRASGQTGSEAAIFLTGVAALMLMTGLVAAAWPARRSLLIQPMEALRIEE